MHRFLVVPKLFGFVRVKPSLNLIGGNHRKPAVTVFTSAAIESRTVDAATARSSS